MSFEYSSDIVTTSTGEVNVEFYKQEAGRLRSAELSSLFHSMVKYIKNVWHRQVAVCQSLVNAFSSVGVAK